VIYLALIIDNEKAENRMCDMNGVDLSVKFEQVHADYRSMMSRHQFIVMGSIKLCDFAW